MDKNYCPYCMKKTEEAICPRCKRKRSDYESSPRQLPYGTILENRYVIGAVLGEGGFGITYLGIDKRLGLRVAIKEYFPMNWVSRYAENTLEVSFNSNSKEDFEKGRKRFLREAHTMAMMEKQPDIVGVKDFFEAYGTAYIVMEYVDGETLKERVKNKGTMPANVLLPMVEPIMKALKVMHEAGLTHRDISPDNLMLEEGHLRLIDFGCARETTAGDETLTIVLKHGYSPVEQYKHKGQGPWTDVYALCATMYFCLTGTVPPQAVDRLLNDEIIPPNELGAHLTDGQEAALLKGMGVKPEDRFQSVDALHRALYQESIIDEEKDSGQPDDKESGKKPRDDGSGQKDIIEVVDYRTEKQKKHVEISKEDDEDSEDKTVFVGEEKKEEEAVDEEKAPYTKQLSDKEKKLKKILPAAIIAAVVIIILIIIIAVRPGKSGTDTAESESAEDETEEVSEVYWDYDEESGTLTISGTGRMDDYEYGSVNTPWSNYAEEITSVVIEEGITYIGENNFRGCTALTSVTLPETLTEIGVYAFRNCNILTQIDIPAGVTWIEPGAFYFCLSLENIYVDEGNETYASEDGIVFSKDGASLVIFPAGKDISTYTVSGSIVSIEESAFATNNKIMQINIPDSVEYIGEFAFYNCTSLLEINVSGTNTDYASEEGVLFTKDMETLLCYPCGNTGKSYTVPDGVTLIESKAFFNCDNLEEIILPDSVETVGSYSFAESSSLENITLSDSLETIYNHAFLDTAVTVLYLPVTVNTIYEYAFKDCANLTEIHYAGSEEEWDAIIIDENNEEALSTITIYFNSEE